MENRGRLRIRRRGKCDLRRDGTISIVLNTTGQLVDPRVLVDEKTKQNTVWADRGDYKRKGGRLQVV